MHNGRSGGLTESFCPEMNVSSHIEPDSVVMLTWSNWHTEPRSNRYHYATRFAQKWPVLFVQPDLHGTGWTLEPTEVSNITVLHIPQLVASAQSAAIDEAMRSQGFVHPIFWLYNPHFIDYVRTAHSAWKVFHATEDYFAPEFFPAATGRSVQTALVALASIIDMVVAVSAGVLQSFRVGTGFGGESLVLQNGCDFQFWSAGADSRGETDERTVVYQGGINRRLDFDLLGDVIRALPDWRFELCGKVDPTCKRQVAALRKHNNAQVLGHLPLEEVRKRCQRGAVGILPFKQNSMISVSAPLKAFEYVAAGLPVVSVPIEALRAFPQCFAFATTPGEFVAAIRMAAKDRRNSEKQAERKIAGRAQDYTVRFAMLEARLRIPPLPAVAGAKGNLLVVKPRLDVEIAPSVAHLLRRTHHRVFTASYDDIEKNYIDLRLFDMLITLDTQSAINTEGEQWTRIGNYSGLKLLIVDSLASIVSVLLARNFRPQAIMFLGNVPPEIRNSIAMKFGQALTVEVADSVSAVQSGSEPAETANTQSILDTLISLSVRRAGGFELPAVVPAAIDLLRHQVRAITTNVARLNCLPAPWPLSEAHDASTVLQETKGCLVVGVDALKNIVGSVVPISEMSTRELVCVIAKRFLHRAKGLVAREVQ